MNKVILTLYEWFPSRGREAGNAETEKLSEKDKMLEEKEAEV
jgi:hypothetical protein